MEREVSFMIELAVTLIALAALIGILWFTIFMGKTMANDAAVKGSDMTLEIQAGVLEDLCSGDTIMPTAAVYNILRTYGSCIPSCTCNLHAVPVVTDLSQGRTPCLMQHMKGKVSLQVEKNVAGEYEITIHHMECGWMSGTCNCADLIA